VLRKARKEGKHFVSELVEAKFVGQSMIRPRTYPASGVPAKHGAETFTGRHLPPMARAGHWKRQRCGKAGADRKWIFIHDYLTGTPEEWAEKLSKK
jgi:hypothetical protein